MFDQRLMTYFKFDQADLQANQNGQFTEKQKARMIKDSKSNGIMDNLGAYIVVFIALIGVVIALVSILMGIQSSNFWVMIPFVFSFGCIWPLVWGGFGVRGLLASNSSKHQFTLAKVQGYANMESRMPSGSNSPADMIYTLHIGNKNFKVDKTLTDGMTHGSQHIVYYYIRDDLQALLSTKNILSAELV